MIETFDLVVIGSGSAAQTVASRCRKAGWTVAMIDKRPFGGTCALRGCDPKKVLVGAAAAVDAARFVGPAQIDVGGTVLNATRAIVIAAGARPADLAVDGQEHVITSDQFLDL